MLPLTTLRRQLSIAQTAIVSKKIGRKIVVFESDDWGSIRTPPNVGLTFKEYNLDLTKNPYHQFDILESPDDLEALLNTLSKINKETGKKVKLTYNNVSANPDFTRIQATNYQEYSYEPFTKTYDRYFGSTAALNHVKQGMAEEFILPQFHGREHLHVPFWLEQLQEGDKVFLKAFKYAFWGLGKDVYTKPTRNVQAAFNIRNESDKMFAMKAIDEGLDMHHEAFGVQSESFIPNNYIWPSSLNHILVKKGVRYMQGMKKHVEPILAGGTKKSSILRKAGYETDSGLINLVRNTSFEPSLCKNKDKEVQKCLDEIKLAFFFRQPAVISTHRINFVGGLVEENRTENLRLFIGLIKSIVKKWPEVEFWDSVQLGKYYKSNFHTG